MLRLVMRGLLDLVWPPRTRCLLCEALLAGEAATTPPPPATGGKVVPIDPNERPDVICSGCWESMGFRPGVTRCKNCCRPTMGGAQRCAECQAGSPFGRVYALGLHEGALREAIHHLKFGGRADLGVPLGQRLAPLVKKRPDLIVAVPLHRSRLRERGYNQAALIAEGLAGRLGVPVAGGLVRLRSTGHQAQLERTERLHNLDGAFGAARQPEWVGKTVLLVDDVLTTGATAAAVAGVLRRTGAKSVNLAVLAVSATPVLGLSNHEK